MKDPDLLYLAAAGSPSENSWYTLRVSYAEIRSQEVFREPEGFRGA